MGNSSCAGGGGKDESNGKTRQLRVQSTVNVVHERRGGDSGIHHTKVKNHVVRCGEGHVMHAKVEREMIDPIRCLRESVECADCGGEVDHEEVYYRCGVCDYNSCSACARQQLALPVDNSSGDSVLALGPGDVIYCGPTKMGIHHCILVRDHLQRQTDLEDMMHEDCPTWMEPGIELWGCRTVESAGHLAGEDTWWYPSTTILARNRHTGSVSLWGDWNPETNDVDVAITVYPVKLLLHPLRQEFGGEGLDETLFEDIIIQTSEDSQKYSWKTAVKAFTAARKPIQSEDYPDDDSLEALMEQFTTSWAKPPICPSVVVKVWQRYLLMSTGDDSVAAAQKILEVMPVWCDRVTPNALLKTLTQFEWVMVEDIEHHYQDD